MYSGVLTIAVFEFTANIEGNVVANVFVPSLGYGMQDVTLNPNNIKRYAI